MFFCYFMLKGDGIDDMNVLKIVLDLRKILDGDIMIDLGIFMKKEVYILIYNIDFYIIFGIWNKLNGWKDIELFKFWILILELYFFFL